MKKFLACLLCLFFCFGVMGAGTSQAEEVVGVPIIMYHSILKSKKGMYSVHPSLLREDTGENANNSAFSAYGYLFDPDIPCMMKPDPETASVVQKIFQMHLSGILTNQIATYLTKEGIPSPITRRKQMGTTFHYGSSHWSFLCIFIYAF